MPTWIYYVINNVALATDYITPLKPYLSHWGLHQPDGRDHVFFFVGDKGACGAPSGPIYMTLWGLTVPWSYMGREGAYKPPAAPSSSLASAPDGPSGSTIEPIAAVGGDDPCADERSIVVPTYSAAELSSVSTVSTGSTGSTGSSEASSASASYTYLLSFSGSIDQTGSTAASTACNASEQARGWTCGAKSTYSQGVRQLVHSLYSSTPGFYIQAGSSPESIFTESRL